MRLKGTEAEQEKALKELRKRFETGQELRHYKGGIYGIVSLSLFQNSHHEDLDGIVVVNYHDIVYPEKLYTRPLDEFLDCIVTADGKLLPRFSMIV